MLAPDFSLYQKLSQGQIQSPQVLHALKILQVPAVALEREIADEMAKNPLLEEVPDAARSREPLPQPPQEDARGGAHGSDDGEDVGSDALPARAEDAEPDPFPEKEDWADAATAPAGTERPWSREDDERRAYLFDSLVEKESLPQLLESQIALADAPGVPAELLRAIAQNIDERGFLDVPVAELAEKQGVPAERMERALEVFQNFDPPGVGARDLREAFLIQLRRAGREDSLAYRILDTDYKAFLARKFPAVADRFGVSDAEVRAAIAEIAKLKRVPAGDYSPDENREIVPDLTFFFDREKNAWDVRMENAYIPRLRISNVYKELIAQGKVPAKDRAYFAEKMRAGRFLISAIEQRQRTIERIARCILAAQRDFFEQGPAKMRPMKMSDIAAEIGVHETTVSRAVADKYAATPYGVVELRRFFNAGVETDGGEALANAGVREVLRKILDEEPPQKPFSDEKLAKELAARGIRIARRTIAKYRGMMNIPPAHLRKKF